MAIERVFYCDAPECERHVRTASARPQSGILIVTGHGKPLHFCGWDCCLKFGAQIPPEEIIPFYPEGEGE